MLKAGKIEPNRKKPNRSPCHSRVTQSATVASSLSSCSCFSSSAFRCCRRFRSCDQSRQPAIQQKPAEPEDSRHRVERNEMSSPIPGTASTKQLLSILDVGEKKESLAVPCPSARLGGAVPSAGAPWLFPSPDLRHGPPHQTPSPHPIRQPLRAPVVLSYNLDRSRWSIPFPQRARGLRRAPRQRELELRIGSSGTTPASEEEASCFPWSSE